MSQRIDLLLRTARDRIDAADAELLLAHVLERSRAWLFAHGDVAPDARSGAEFQQLVARRAAGEPLAYLVGRRGFWRFELEVSPATLVPRPETELLVEQALAVLPGDRPLRVADLGTGSGAVALALALERPRAQVVATDASAAALAVARRNADALRLGNVDFRQGDWFAPVAGERFAVVASNPPYIAEGDAHLAALVHEPRMALTSGADGLDAIRVIAAAAPSHLEEGGWLLLEHGLDQGASVRALLQAAGLCEVHSCRDLEARERVTMGRRVR